MLARAVIHGELGDAEAPVVREHRDEPVELAVETQPVNNVRAVRLEAAVEVVHTHT